jgi:hypothetical protein
MARAGKRGYKIFDKAETIMGWYTASNKNEKINAMTSQLGILK